MSFLMFFYKLSVSCNCSISEKQSNEGLFRDFQLCPDALLMEPKGSRCNVLYSPISEFGD